MFGKYCLSNKINNYSIKNNEDFCESNFDWFENEDIIVLLDGHIFFDKVKINFNDLKVHMIKLSKTKLVIEESMLGYFNINTSGDFNLIVLFKQFKKLYVVRDPLGHKVAFLQILRDSFVISDSLKNFLKREKKILDLEYFKWCVLFQTPGFLEKEFTPIKGVYRALAGKILIYDFNNNKVNYIPYFNVNDLEIDFKMTELEAKENFDIALCNSFTENMNYMGNSYVGVSGGIDSSVICEYLDRNDMKKVNYLNYKVQNADVAYTDDIYISILEKRYNIEIEHLELPFSIPYLLRKYYSTPTSKEMASEPGTIGSIENNKMVSDFIKKSGKNTLVLGYEESIFRNVKNSSVIEMENKKQIYSYTGNINSTKELEYCYQMFSNKLKNHPYFSSFYKSFGCERFLSLQELKYNNMISPNLECVSNFVYNELGINIISPLHSTELVKFAICTPVKLFYNDPKYCFKKIDGVPLDIYIRAKTSVSPIPILKQATMLAANLLESEMICDKLINRKFFNYICLKIIHGKFNMLDYRLFFSIVSFEKYIKDNDFIVDI